MLVPKGPVIREDVIIPEQRKLLNIDGRLCRVSKVERCSRTGVRKFTAELAVFLHVNGEKIQCKQKQ